MNEALPLNAREAGQGPLLVILHGMFGNLDNFASVSLHLERHFRILRLDLPGHGQSPRIDSLDHTTVARYVREDLLSRGVQRCYLLGHSLGGKIAMAMASEPGALAIERLIVIDIAPKDYPPHHQEILEALLALDTSALGNRGDAERQLRQSIPDAGVRAFLIKSLYRSDTGGFAWRFDLERLHACYEAIARAPQIAGQIDTPTLFIKGGNSDYLAAGDEARIHELFTRPELKIISGAGHWPHGDKPALVARIVQQFLTADGGTD